MPISETGSKKNQDVYVSKIEDTISSFLNDEIDNWRKIDASIVPPLEALKVFFEGGGKRLRPSFCYLSYCAHSNGSISQEILNLGSALELLHNFAIIHDDIMDRADTRRGMPTVHRFLESFYDEQQYEGDIEHFALSVAILTGDFAFTYADRFTRGLPDRCMGIYDILKTELFAGQQMDLDAVYKKEISKEEISKIAQYKSGKYTIERPLHLGALLADENADIDTWSKYGSPLGEAFQLRDDVLGIFGQPGQTGKPVGDDLREGKYTLLLAQALENANSEQIDILNMRGNSALPQEDIDSMIRIIDEVGALDAVEKRIQELYDESLTALDGMDLNDEVRSYAHYLAKYVCWREQ